MMTLVIMIIVLSVVGAGAYLRLSIQEEEDVSIVTVGNRDPVQELVVEKTEEDDMAVSPLEKQDISLEILNATGQAGLAKTKADVFEALGYEIVNVGNAPAESGNKLYVKRTLEEEMGSFLSDVKKELNISTITGYLSESAVFSARIILGTEKEEDE